MADKRQELRREIQTLVDQYESHENGVQVELFVNDEYLPLLLELIKKVEFGENKN